MALPLILTLASILLFLLTLYKAFIHPRFLSPLSPIPTAHWSARYSPLWILWYRYRARNNATTLAAHEKYGPIVLLGPTEISVNCVDGGIRTVYAGGFEKSSWYPRLFVSYDVVNMFSTVGHGEHSAKKRLLSNVYSKSYLQGSKQVEANSKALLSQRILPLIQGFAETGESVEVHGMNNAFTMDFMSAYQFGLANATNFTQDSETRRRVLHDYHCRKEYEFYHQEVPGLRDLTAKFGFPIVPSFCTVANTNIEIWNSAMCNGAEKLLQETNDNVPNPGDEPVVYKQFKAGFAKLPSKEKAQDPESVKAEIHSEMLDHIAAGHETSGIALTYLYHELSQRPTLQAQLRAEVLQLSPQILWPPPDASTFELPSPKSIDALPLLHAVLMETLRLHAPIPGVEPRVTPATGCTLAGYENIPGGVRVSAMPYTLHRNPDVFPDPLSFRPERWLHATEEQTKEMLRWFWAFGSGGRMCIGSHFAMQEIKLILAAIYGNWRTEIVDDEGIEEIDAYTTRPSRSALDLRFVRV